MRMCVLVILSGVISFPCLGQSPNVFPDPAFDRTGNTDGGRNGGLCLTVAAQEKIRWKGSRTYILDLEPFARYRISGYAKSEGKGGRRALLGYGWNSFDWRYQCGVTVEPDGQWRQYETTFACPVNKYTLHPAALSGAENAQVWVDDVTIEKIAEPEAVIAEIAAKNKPSMEDLEFLARVHIAEGEFTEALALAAKADQYTQADIYCALALATEDDALRGKRLADMLAHGGTAYNNALTRLDEITKDRPAGTILAWLNQAEDVCQAGDAAMAWAIASLHLGLQLLDQTSTCTEAAKLLERMDVANRKAQTVIAAKACMPRFEPILTSLLQKLSTARETWNKRRESLGTCMITISGNALTAATHDIVLPSEPHVYETYAAKQLQLYLERLIGTAPKIAKALPSANHNGIYIGRAPETVKSKLKTELADLGDEAFLIQTLGPDLHIIGGLRGALYGVYSLLEDYLGCGWYMPGPVGEVVPREGVFALNNISDLQRPSFTWRGLSSVGDASWCIKNKIDPTISGSRYGIDKGDPAFFGTFGHNYARLVPPSKYFLSHPEYFSLVKGERKWDHTQLCTTNPDVIRLCAEGICRDIERQPECKVFALCQNDWAGWCECDNCTALDVRSNSKTDRIIVFCNAVSKLVRERYPDKQIYTYAYQAGVEPPEHEIPDPALGVQLCHIRHPCSHSHPIETARNNVEYKSWVEGWTNVTKQLFVYDYRVNYSNYLMPYPNCCAIMRDVPYYHRRGVRNLFYQGGGSAHNFGLCHYLLAKLMWNVNEDPDALVDRYFDQYYGPVAEPMRAYWNLLHNTVVEKNIEMNLYSTPPPDLFTPECIATAESCFDEAESRAGNTVYRDRIDWERITLYWVKLAAGKRPVQITLTDSNMTVGRAQDDTWREDLAEFIQIAKKFRIWRIRESSWRGSVDIRGFVEEVSGLDVHDRWDYQYPTNESDEGRRCVTVRANVNTPSSSWRQRYPMILKGNTEYRASCRVRSEGDEAFSAIPLQLRGAVTLDGQSVTGKTPWHTIEFTFRTPDVDSASVTAHVGRVTKGTGQIWIDDLRVVALDSPEKNRVENGNFEKRRGVEPDYWIRPSCGSAMDWTDMSPVKGFLEAPTTHKIPGQEPHSYPIVSLSNDHIQVDTVPTLGGRIQRIVDRTTRTNICYNPTEAKKQGHWTNYGGYEEYTSPELGGPGWECPYEAQKTPDGKTLILTAHLSDRSIRRILRLLPDAPALEISSEITNTSKAPIKARLRIHPIFHIGVPTGKCTLFSRRTDGPILQEELKPERADLWLKNADFAAGAWALRNSNDGSGLLNTFEATHVNTTYICIQPNEGINLELMSPIRTLKPGEKLQITHSYRLLPPKTEVKVYKTLVEKAGLSR